MKLSYPDLDPAASALRELEDEVEHIRQLLHPMYPDNGEENDAHIEDDLKLAAKNAAILGARVQGRIAVLLHKFQAGKLTPVVTSNKQDVWCHKHHQLDDC